MTNAGRNLSTAVTIGWFGLAGVATAVRYVCPATLGVLWVGFAAPALGTWRWAFVPGSR